MNANGRKMIKGYISSLEDIKQDIESLLEDEETKFDNMPEGLQESERGETIQNAIDNLEGASDSIGDAIDYLSELTE